MKTLCSSLVAFAVVLALSFNVMAEEKKGSGSEVTLKGKIACGKCTFKLDGLSKCQIVIAVQEGEKGKEKVAYYYFDADSHKKYHEEYCKISKEGSVMGVVSEKDGKKWVKVTSLKAD